MAIFAAKTYLTDFSASSFVQKYNQLTLPLKPKSRLSDDITTPDQVLSAKNYVGTPKDRIVEKIGYGTRRRGCAPD